MSLSEAIKIPKSHRTIRLSGRSNVIKAKLQSDSELTDAGNDGGMQSLPAITEQAVHEAYQKGIEEGSRRTSDLLQSEYAHRVQIEQKKINDVLSEIELYLKKLSSQTEQALLDFSLGIAGNIVRQELSLHPEIVLNIIKDGIRNIIGVEKIKIRMNPVHKNLVQEEKRSIQSLSESIREIIFEPDESIEVGGCIIESDIGNVDARIATQLEQVQKIFTEQQ
jgi:flagellar assembly protein FliH